MLGNHRWEAQCAPDIQYFAPTFADSYAFFTPDSAFFYRLTLVMNDAWDSIFYESRTFFAFHYTFRPPDTYFFDSIRYVVDAYPENGLVRFWGSDGTGFLLEKERFENENTLHNND